jgi:hypothetical protein
MRLERREYNQAVLLFLRTRYTSAIFLVRGLLKMK